MYVFGTVSPDSSYDSDEETLSAVSSVSADSVFFSWREAAWGTHLGDMCDNYGSGGIDLFVTGCLR